MGKPTWKIPGARDSVGEVVCCAADGLQSPDFPGRASSPLMPVDSKAKKSHLTNLMDAFQCVVFFLIENNDVL